MRTACFIFPMWWGTTIIMIRKHVFFRRQKSTLGATFFCGPFHMSIRVKKIPGRS